MFERYTDGARRVLVLADEEARTLNHNYLGTEHLLLGLIREGDGMAAQGLRAMGVSLEAARLEVEAIVGQGQQPPPGHIQFTPRLKKVLELAVRERDVLGQEYVGTEHLLLGLIREGDGVGAQILVRAGADLNRTREQVVGLIHGQLLGDVHSRVEALERRVAAIERWVGMRPDPDGLDQEITQARQDKEAAIERQDFETAAAARDKEARLRAARDAREREGAEPAAGRPSLAGELRRVSAELERLRAVLREHGIEPGDEAT